MKLVKSSLILFSIGVCLVTNVSAQTSVYVALRAAMETACPVIWEDLGTAISESQTSGDIWQADQGDKAAFIAQYLTNNPSLSQAELEQVASNNAAVAQECAAYRIALIEELLAKTPVDVATALTAASTATSSGINLESAWQTGDVRVTGRANSIVGWVFLTGQTIGFDNSSADLKGSDYQELFELAKNWAPNSGTENWSAGDAVILPDMRGRTIYAADNMGGASANVMTDVAANTVGGSFGAEQLVLAENQMPSHSHNMNTAGNHGHTMGYAGNHNHSIRTSVYNGSTIPNWGTYFSGKGRPGYESTKSAPVRPNGNHKHSLSNSGNHAHTLSNAGGSEPVKTLSPGIVFNVEMKY